MMDKSDLQEQLLRLYLRLNGFFASGFIVHSPNSTRNKTEIDTLAVRFPHSCEPERNRTADETLDLSQRRIELAICEAKTKPRFNEALYSDPAAIITMLRWVGMFAEPELHDLVPKVQAILVPEKHPAPNIRRLVANENVVIRSLLFCPELPEPRVNQSWFVGAGAIFPFIFSCLSPAFEPPTCGRRYGAAQWGELSDLVEFFKRWPQNTPPSYEDLAKWFSDPKQADG